jgi:hypothetical protein
LEHKESRVYIRERNVAAVPKLVQLPVGGRHIEGLSRLSGLTRRNAGWQTIDQKVVPREDNLRFFVRTQILNFCPFRPRPSTANFKDLSGPGGMTLSLSSMRLALIFCPMIFVLFKKFDAGIETIRAAMGTFRKRNLTYSKFI